MCVFMYAMTYAIPLFPLSPAPNLLIKLQLCLKGTPLAVGLIIRFEPLLILT